eukprot:scaffold376708_cov20-Prasinocladus_malaysianus.AAC.1
MERNETKRRDMKRIKSIVKTSIHNIPSKDSQADCCLCAAQAMEMDDVLDNIWDDSQCFFGWDEEDKVNVGRAYGRVSRGKLRTLLLKTRESHEQHGMSVDTAPAFHRCQEAGVKFAEGEVTEVVAESGSAAGQVTLKSGNKLQARLVALASGAVAGKFLEFEENAPS